MLENMPTQNHVSVFMQRRFVIICTYDFDIIAKIIGQIQLAFRKAWLVTNAFGICRLGERIEHMRIATTDFDEFCMMNLIVFLKI